MIYLNFFKVLVLIGMLAIGIRGPNLVFGFSPESCSATASACDAFCLVTAPEGGYTHCTPGVNIAVCVAYDANGKVWTSNSARCLDIC